MAGLLVLGIAAVWLLFAAKVGRAAANWHRPRLLAPFVGISVFVLTSVLPFADEIAGRWQFHRLCKERALVWVHPAATEVSAALAMPMSKDLGGFIFPIHEQVSEYVDSTTAEPFLRITSFHTPGGFIMRAGLNMGGSSSCRPERWTEPYRSLKIDELLKRGKK